MIEILFPLAKGLMQLTGVLSIGFLITLSFLDQDIKGAIKNHSLVKKTRLFISAWLLVSALYVIVQVSYLLDQPLAASFDLTVIRSYLTQTSLGKAYLVQIIGILILLLIPLRRLLGSYISLLIALIAITAPVFQSHGSSSGNHGLAIGALIIHVMALSFWVGGLFGLTQLSKQQKLIALPRFSEIALWSAITVVISGAATAWTRLDSLQAWQSKYGVITLVKISLAFTLVGFGALHRRWIIKSDYPSVFRLITADIGVMFTTVFVGSWFGVKRALNGQINSFSKKSFATSQLNFITGFSFLTFLLILRSLFTDHSIMNLTSGPWWMFLGGSIGVFYIAFSAIAVQHVGVLEFTLLSVGGMLIGSLLLDVFVPTEGTQISPYLITGIFLTYLGVIANGQSRFSRK